MNHNFKYFSDMIKKRYIKKYEQMFRTRLIHEDGKIYANTIQKGKITLAEIIEAVDNN